MLEDKKGIVIKETQSVAGSMMNENSFMCILEKLGHDGCTNPAM